MKNFEAKLHSSIPQPDYYRVPNNRISKFNTFGKSNGLFGGDPK